MILFLIGAVIVAIGIGVINILSIKKIINENDITREYNELIDHEFIDPVEVYLEPVDKNKFYKLPTKTTTNAAAYDIYWSSVNRNELNSDGSVTLNPGESAIFGTNLKIEISEENYYLDICSRSGLSIKEGICVSNSPARIDSDYRGEIFIGIRNLSDKPRIIEPQSRIAQCTLHRIINTNFSLSKVHNNTKRGENGLGSTGEK